MIRVTFVVYCTVKTSNMKFTVRAHIVDQTSNDRRAATRFFSLWDGRGWARSGRREPCARRCAERSVAQLKAKNIKIFKLIEEPDAIVGAQK